MSEPAATAHPTYSFKGFTLDLDRGCLWRGGDEVRLRPKVFEALRYLVLNNNRLITKDELIKAVWAEPFVSDDSLVQCLVELRRALGDEAQACLKTVPRRGYIFTAAVSEARVPAPGPAAPTAPEEAPLAAAAPAARAPRAAVTLLALAAAAIAASLVWTRQPRRTVAFTEKDGILIAEFANSTGDEVFDGTLRQAMAVQLGQSPFLDVFPEERVRETLRYMGRPPTERVTRELAREIARRQGVSALLAGSISTLGQHYVISLEAVSAASGETFAREQVEAESRERVLGRLGEAAARLRQQLGESIGSIEKFAAPIEQATTPSLEAFKAYDLGRQRHFSGQYFEAIPLYRRAVELDPNFAIAYAALGITHRTAQEYDEAARASRRAFELRERVSERERFYISARYFMDVLADGDRAIETLELWKETYPRDFVPRTNLSARYGAIGRYAQALEEAREGLRLNPDAAVAHAAVAHTLICLDRFQEARAAIEQAAQRKLEPTYGPYMLYGIALLEGDGEAMRRQVERVAGSPAEAGMAGLQSVAAAYAGQVGAARLQAMRAADLAVSRGHREGAGLYWAAASLWEAAYGNCPEASRAAARTLALSRGRLGLSWNALAFALCGRSGDARRLVEEVGRDHPEDSFFKAAWLPMIGAALEIRRQEPARAVELLRPAASGETGYHAALWPAYLRGLAYLDLGAGAEAGVEFQKVLDHRGVLAPKDFSTVAMILYPLARLGRARAARLKGDVDASRQEYEALFALWKDADPDIPALKAARREYRQLGAARAGRGRAASLPRRGRTRPV